MNFVEILIVDDHEMFRGKVRSLIESQPQSSPPWAVAIFVWSKLLLFSIATPSIVGSKSRIRSDFVTAPFAPALRACSRAIAESF